jgi:hypothetical protein
MPCGGGKWKWGEDGACEYESEEECMKAHPRPEHEGDMPMMPEEHRTLKTCSAERCTCGHAEKLDGKYRYKISTESLDCEGERILISSWVKLGKFPLLLNHVGNEVGQPIDLSKAIGTAQVFIREGELVADIDITDPKVKARVEAGELRSASVGYRRLEAEKTTSGTIVTTKAELREVSLVEQGCNYDAARIKRDTAFAALVESVKSLQECAGTLPESLKNIEKRLELLEIRLKTQEEPPKPAPKPTISTEDLKASVREGLREAIRTKLNYHSGRLDD